MDQVDTLCSAVVVVGVEDIVVAVGQTGPTVFVEVDLEVEAVLVDLVGNLCSVAEEHIAAAFVVVAD